MQFVVVAVGARMPSWVDMAFDDYVSRMPPELGIDLREVKPEPRTSGKTVDAMMGAEATRIRGVLPKRGPRVVLDEHGIELTSVDLAKAIGTWRATGDDVSFIIGGPDGLDAGVKAEAAMRVRLSSMTLPHGMARVLLAEQLYRAWSITQNHPYHRA